MASGIESLKEGRAKPFLARPRSKKGRLGAVHLAILVLALLASIAAGYAGYGRFASAEAPKAQPTTSTVRRGTITASVNLSGSTASMSQAKLTFETAGRLTQVLVKAGDSVKEGDVLARVDTADLELQVAQAEVALEQARLKLDQLKAGPKSEDLAAAQASARDAEIALANSKDSLILANKSATVTKNVRDREYEHNWYEVRYGETLDKFNRQQASQADLDKIYADLLTAKERLDSARLEAEMAIRKSDNEVARAEESLRKANSQLATLSAGASSTDIATQEVAVRQAEATLKQRQLSLQKATLRAPFGGVVDSVSGNVGEQVSTSKEVMTIVNMERFRVDARVDETDVSRLAKGQTANITIDALSNTRLSARVVSIAAIPVTQQGVVNYPIVLELDPTQAAVRPGMTASVAVEVARQENVLLVPNRAVRGQVRSRTVEVMANGTTETRAVSVGMSDDQSTVVLSGLQEGDVVVLPTTTTTGSNTQRMGGVGGMTGGNVIIPSGGMPGGFGR